MCEAIIAITGIALWCMAGLVATVFVLHPSPCTTAEGRGSEEQGTQTAPSRCMAGEVAVLLGGGVSQPEATSCGGVRVGVRSPPTVPLPPTLSPELLVSPELPQGESDVAKGEVRWCVCVCVRVCMCVYVMGLTLYLHWSGE